MDALRRQATAWVVRLRSGEATTDDRDAFLRWRGESDAHEQALREVSGLWNAIGQAAGAPVPARRGAVSRRAFLVAGGAAAGATGLAAGLGALGIIPSFEAFTADFATAVGEQRDVSLPDGTVVSLDGASTLSLAYTPGVRRVRLSSGVAVFDIAEGFDTPFEVEADEGTTMALHGSFSVKHGSDEVAVDCLRGEASVRCRGTEHLSPGQGIRYSAAGLGEKRSAEADIVTAWRRGLLVFRDQPLKDVVADLNRHRKGKVILASSTLSDRRVSGVFHLERPQEIVAHLESTLHVAGLSLPGGIVLLR